MLFATNSCTIKSESPSSKINKQLQRSSRCERKDCSQKFRRCVAWCNRKLYRRHRFFCILILCVAFGVVLMSSLSMHHSQSHELSGSYTYPPTSHAKLKPGWSKSLPIGQELIGREKEMKMIRDHLSEVSLVILHGPPGFGKSEIILHVGNEMLEAGYNVHYIKVEEISSVGTLEDSLMNVAEKKFASNKLVNWAHSISEKTLLILDNVDGKYWIENHDEFIEKFINVLLSHSMHLKIVITSQIMIGSSVHKYRSHRLEPLTTEKCVLIFNLFLNPRNSVSKDDPEAICELVGNVPLVVKILARTFFVSTKYVINRLKSDRIEFFSHKKINILSALRIAFEHLELEHRICGLMLFKLNRDFDLIMAKSVVTSDLMKKYSGHFFLEDCIEDLTGKFFIESRKSIYGKYMRYDFHVLVRDFMKVAMDEYSITEMLDEFWMNYMRTMPDIHLHYLNSEDIHQINDVLIKDNDYSYDLSISIISLLYSRDVSFNVTLFNSSSSVLLADCKKPGLTGHITNLKGDRSNNFRRLIRAYNILLFSKLEVGGYILFSDDEYLDNFWNCEQKVRILNVQAKGHLGFKHFESTLAYYTNLQRMTIMCNKTQRKHAVCRDIWKFNLIQFGRIFHCEMNPSHDHFKLCPLKTDHDTSIILGLFHYFSMDYDTAVYHLRNAIVNNTISICKELHDVIAHITLYSIFTS